MLLTLLVSGLTGSVSEATYLVSMAAGAVTLLLLGSLLTGKWLVVFLLFPIALTIGAITPLSSLARSSSADMLAVMTAVAIACAGLTRPRLALLMLPLLPSIRPDYILLAPLFAWALYERAHRLETAIALAMAGLVYLLVNSFFSTIGYLAHFNYALIQNFPAYPEEMQLSTSLADYAGAYLNGVKALVSYSEHWLALAGIALACLAVRKSGFRRRSIEGFTLAAAAFMLLHFALWPVGHPRFYALAICLALATVFAAASQRMPSPKA